MKRTIYILSIILIFNLITNVFANTYVASIGESKYETLQQAISAAGSSANTITLVSDINLTGKLSFPKDSNIVLDLNGKTLTVPTVENNYGIVVAGNLTIKGKGTVILGMYGIGVGTTGNLIIEDGTYKCQTGDYLLGSWNKAVIKGGVFDGNYCIANGFNGGTVEIMDGTFYSKEETIVLGGTKVFGGSFNHNVDEYLADGITMKQYNGLYYTGKLYNITVSNTKNGVVSAISQAVEEQPVKLTINANKGYILENVKVKSDDGKLIAVSNGEFVMPSNNVTIFVTFEQDGLDDTPKTGGIEVMYIAVIIASVLAIFIAIIGKAKLNKAS